MVAAAVILKHGRKKIRSKKFFKLTTDTTKSDICKS